MNNGGGAPATPTEGQSAAATVRQAGRMTLQADLDAAIDLSRGWLLQGQHADGFWCGELEGDTILESEYILLLAWLGRERSPRALQAARYLLKQQLPDGGWPLFPGGPLEISASVKAYFALKLTGHDPEAEPLRRARAAIRQGGGADAVNSFTRYYLALLDQISYGNCPAVPPELLLLPDWSPVNLYRISAWSRTIFVPLSVIWAHRPVRQLAAPLGIGELFLRPPQQWPPCRSPGLQSGAGRFSRHRLFLLLDRLWKFGERCRLTPLRRRALRGARRWMLERFEESDGLGAIFPPIVWCVVALRCLGYAEDSPEVRDCLDQLEALVIEQSETVRLQPCLSPVWDTALAQRALLAAGEAPHSDAMQRARRWLLAKEVRRPGDWRKRVQAEPGGWFFEHRNAFYPDVDDTAMVLLALGESLPGAARLWSKAHQESEPLDDGDGLGRFGDACRRGIRWMLALQNRDGGWGAFDKDNDQQWLCHVPFADHNAMIDPSTPDITARVLESLACFGLRQGVPQVDRAVPVRGAQEPDGAWPGRWGVNYIYGVWQVLTGLTAAGVDPGGDSAVVRGAQWLLAHQQPGGGWGESAASYDDPRLRGTGPPTASQTAWAVLGLIAAGLADHPAVRDGVTFLLRRQQPDGSWHEPEFTGTGFPRVFYLRYHLYPVYFPLLALARWRSARQL